MNASLRFAVLAGGVVAGLAAAPASAITYSWDWAPGDPGTYGISNAAGTFQALHTEFNPVNGKFVWEARFSDQVTSGFTLAVSPGPNPKGHGGELALIYVDARVLSDVRITVYNYNGLNTQTSWTDGSPIAGTQAPDRIEASLADDWFVKSSYAYNSGAGRVIGFTLDASDILSHLPVYPGWSDWTGVAYGDELGIWMHPVKNLVASYGDEGQLTSWSGTQGWFDGNGFDTIPTPGAVSLLGLAGALMIRRRRAPK